MKHAHAFILMEMNNESYNVDILICLLVLPVSVNHALPALRKHSHILKEATSNIELYGTLRVCDGNLTVIEQ